VPDDRIDPESEGPEDEGPPNLGDITPWLIEYVRINFAEHSSLLYDQTPHGSIPSIVKWTLAGLVVNAQSDDDTGFTDPRGDLPNA